MNHFPTASLSESSKALYNRMIERWIDVVYNNSHRGNTEVKQSEEIRKELRAKWLKWLIQHPAQAMKALVAEKAIKNSNTNHHIFISAIVSYLTHERSDSSHLKVWRGMQEENSRPIKAHYLKGVPTELQEGKQKAWADIIRVRDELPISEVKLLLGYYTYIPPIRADLYQCRVYEDDRELRDSGENKDGNYVVLGDKARLVLNDYKTRGKYGMIQIPLPQELVKLTNDYFEMLGYPAECLFMKHQENNTHTLYNRSAFSQWATRRLTKAFDKPMTLTAIRHNYMNQVDFNQPISHLNTIAQMMGHAVSTQRTYKWDEKKEGANEIIYPPEKKD